MESKKRGEALAMAGFFYIEKYNDLWVVRCKEDKETTIFGTFGMLYLPELRKALQIDAGFIRNEDKILEVRNEFRKEFHLGLEDFVAVLCTHFHADHFGNPETLPNATYFGARDGIELLSKRPDDVLYKNFSYRRRGQEITMNREVEELKEIIERCYREKEDWIQPLERCPYAREGIVADLVNGSGGIRWIRTDGHAAGHCSYLVNLPLTGTIHEDYLPRYQHLFLGDCLAEDHSDDAAAENQGRKWLRSLGLKKLRSKRTIHTGHLDVRTKRFK
jgi:glyoxylase-like metal-dependent hydrolase (beta-lactamase superfamily II)